MHIIDGKLAREQFAVGGEEYRLTQLRDEDFKAYGTIIPAGAFSGRVEIKKVFIPAVVHTLAEGAFSNCTSLREVVIENDSAMTTIGKRAFEGCTALRSINLTTTVKNIGEFAFHKTHSSFHITFPRTGMGYTLKKTILQPTSKSVTTPPRPGGRNYFGDPGDAHCCCLNRMPGAFDGWRTGKRWEVGASGRLCPIHSIEKANYIK